MSLEPVFSLQDHLCFSIYACSRAISRMYQPLLKKLGITYPQYLVLLVLWENSERSVKQLGEKLELDSGTLTPLLKRMEGKGLILRERTQEDERVVNIHLTNQGTALQKEAVCIPLALAQSSGMTMEEIQKLNEKIKILTNHVANFSENRPSE
ncbi:MarR family winged helix-turn-helix transcriptional regulator [Sporolactobacillus sp. STSJ-5]|uniref:MarR family winged helix-turn-helix transcriptional regulator n=1 Tax=Sporolactobacillus sp. STSJ-5 TaxID=2965076 RepID=UPI00351D81B3